jgi:sugar phosphate permease
MIKDLQMTKTQAGMIKGVFSLTYLLFSPLMGWLTDRMGGRKVISFFCLFLGGGTFLMGKANGFTSAAFFYCLIGIGAAAGWVPITALIQNWFGARKRGLVLGILSVSSGIGFGLMGLILPVIVLKYHWRAGWSILGLFGFSLVLMNGFLLRDKPEKMGFLPWGESDKSNQTTKGMNPAVRGVDYFGILRKPPFWIIGISYLTVSYGIYAIVDFIVTYGTMELKIPYRVASLLITVISFTGVFGGILLMGLSDYIGRQKSLVITQVLIAMTILFVIVGRNHIFSLMLAIGCFGFLFGAIWPMYAACARDYFSKEVTGTVFGLLTIFYGVGTMVSPALTGYLADVTGTFRWPFGLGAFTCFVAVLSSDFWRGRKNSENFKALPPNKM